MTPVSTPVLRRFAGPGLALAQAAALAACAASAPPAPSARPGESPDHAAAVARHLEEAGLAPGRVTVAGGDRWRAAAEGASTLAEALDRAGLPGVRVEPRGGSFCARSPASTDCMFVTVLGAEGEALALREVDLSQVEAVGLGEPAPPDESGNRMLWREELRTGHIVIFLRGWSGG